MTTVIAAECPAMARHKHRAGRVQRAEHRQSRAKPRTKILLFMTTSAVRWVVGSRELLRFDGVHAGYGVGSEFQYLVAAVVGGCLLIGGFGSVVVTAIGALTFGMARQGTVFARWKQRLVHAVPRDPPAVGGTDEHRVRQAHREGTPVNELIETHAAVCGRST
ncbi:ABC transporter permease subunit [Nocardia yamanashiensis]|uniref:ABC transporter permease subunit n=1 Tax=Nocardia yamanashiensis TaxID=209247 RepID=UPI001F40801F|nr:hypothetical protein [Nocardia yamanashiensis]